MAKPKTKGAPIQVRLPLDVDGSVRAKALKQGVSPSAAVEEIVTRAARSKVIAIGSGVQAPIEGKTAPEHIIIDDPIHEHKKRTVNGANLHVCKCGAVRGVDGVWR